MPALFALRRRVSVIMVSVLAIVPAHAEKGPADALADLPDALLWHFKVFVMLPANIETFGKAVEAQRGTLKPGESKDFRVIMNVDSEGEPVRFVRLEPADQDALRAANEKTVASIQIGHARLVFTPPVVPLDKESFEKIARGLPKDRSQINYEDYVFAVQSSNHLMGFKQSFDLKSIKSGKPTFARNELVDLLDEQARAADKAHVILVAREEENDYGVYDIDHGRASKSPKGPAMKAAGNSVWLLAQPWPGYEYTIVYRHLRSMDVRLGDTVDVSQPFGTLSRSNQKTQVEVWRVNGAAQRFLRQRGEPHGAYQIWGRLGSASD